MNTVLFVNATIGFSENLFLVNHCTQFPQKKICFQLDCIDYKCRLLLVKYISFRTEKLGDARNRINISLLDPICKLFFIMI